MRLSDLKTGESAVIVKILGHGAFRKRVMEMGFVKGRKISAVMTAPLNDPVKYRLMNYEVSLRRAEASMIEVMPLEISEDEYASVDPETAARKYSEKFNRLTAQSESWEGLGETSRGKASEITHTINVALIGNPNCGKTSLFNFASGAREHVGNYSGVTVDSKSGTFTHGGYSFNIVDLPGTYSLSAYSPEERYVRTYLRENNPDVIVNVVDSSNLERNLYLTTELIDMDHSMVIALNMFDELRRSGVKFDYKALGYMIGVPICPTVSRTGEGIEHLFDTIIKVYEGKEPAVRHVHVRLSPDVENVVTAIKDALKEDKSINQHFSPRYLAIRLLEHDDEVEHIVSESAGASRVFTIRDKVVRELNKQHPEEDISDMIADDKYGFISGALAETIKRPEKEMVSTSHLIDLFVTNRLFGFPIFLILMAFIFWVTFAVGAYPAGWIEDGVAWLSDLLRHHMADGPLKDLLVNGVIGGVGGVIVFLPNIMILFFFISFMEDSGYMARAAFIMDRLMHKIGLHGKSFIPLVMGFGCNVPAVMACRAIESRSSKIITVLITPFMSCSARLPVYVLLVGTFFSAHAALVFLCMYLLGALVAMGTARLLRRFFFKVDETPFVMELPPYRVPTMKTSLRHMWWKGKQYLQKMGGIILLASVIVWAFDYFPLGNRENPQVDSYLESVGKAVQPVMEPLGTCWQGTVAMLAGVPAKEIVVSTMGVLFTGDDEATDRELSQRITSVDPSTGVPYFTAASALAFMVFILLYCPCMATIVAVARETGHWGYAAFSIIYNTAVAWIIAFIVYRIALLF